VFDVDDTTLATWNYAVRAGTRAAARRRSPYDAYQAGTDREISVVVLERH